MQGANTAALRVALALPLAFEAYRLITFAMRADRWSALSFLIVIGETLLPALGFSAACVLVLPGRSSRMLWLLLAASGLWLVSVDLYTWRGVRAPWRPSVEFAMGTYAMLLALAFLLGDASAQSRQASLDPDPDGSTHE